MKAFVFIAVLSVVSLSTGCQHGVTASTQPTPSAEQQIYADLLTAQTAIEGLIAQPTLIAPWKDQVNQAVASYNLAEKAFVDYEQAKGSNLANPADLLKIQTMILDVESQVAKLGPAFKPTATATPNPPIGASK